MSLRACCLVSLTVCLTAGCQTSSLGLLPWKQNAPEAEFTAAEPKQTLDGPTVSGDAFMQASASTESESDAPTRDTVRLEQWLQRGQKAIEEAEKGVHRAEMLSEASVSYREVLKLDRKNVRAFHGLAIVSDLNQDWQLAELNYKKALEITPNDIHLLNNLGYSYLLQKRYDEASGYLQRAIEISPQHEEAHVNLAILDVQRGDQQTALKRLSRVYSGGKAQSALMTILREHSIPVASQNISQVAASTAPSPNRSSGRPTGFASGNQMPAVQSPAIQPPVSQPQPTQQTPPWHADQNAQQDQSPLFTPNGVISAPVPGRQGQTGSQFANGHPAEDRTVAKPSTGMSRNQVQGRPAGHIYELPPQTSVIRPQLPPAANVYRGGQVSPGQQSHMPPVPAQSASTPTTMPGTTPGRIPQAWLNSQENPSQSSVNVAYPQMAQAGIPQGGMAPAGSSTDPSGYQGRQTNQVAANNQPYNASQFPNAAAGAGNSGTQPHVGQQHGGPAGSNGFPTTNGYGMANQQPHGHQPGLAPQQQLQNQQQAGGYNSNQATNGLQMPAVGYGQQNAGQQVVGQPYAGQQSVAQPFSGQPVQGQQYAGQVHSGQNAAVSSNQQSFGPQYFSPPPLAGAGFSTPGQTAPDPLAEYHATRRKLEQDYQQTLNQVNQPVGGNTFH